MDEAKILELWDDEHERVHDFLRRNRYIGTLAKALKHNVVLDSFVVSASGLSLWPGSCSKLTRRLRTFHSNNQRLERLNIDLM